MPTVLLKSLYRILKSGVYLGLLCTLGLHICLTAKAGVPQPTEDIALQSNVSAESWWLNRTPKDLIDGNPRLIWAKSGWYSGTRFPTNAGIFQIVPIYFDFHRSEPSTVSGVELVPNMSIAFAVDLFDGQEWRQVAQNGEPGADRPIAPAKVTFATTPGYSVRVRLLGYMGPVNPDHFPNWYKVGEIKISGSSSGSDLANGLQIDAGTDSQRVASVGEPLRLPIKVSWQSLPQGVEPGDFEIEATLGRRYGNRTLQTRVAAVSPAPQTVAFDNPAPGAYMVRLAVRHKKTGATLFRTETTLGVVNPAWADAKIEPLPCTSASFSAPLGLTAAHQPQKWVRCVDVNGVDSILDVPCIDYYLGVAAKTGAVAEIFLPWASLEPLPGVYDFDLADQWFNAAARLGVRLRINTNPPYSGFLPKWLAGHQILQQQADGTTVEVESPTIFSPLVREHATRLFELLMKRYGSHPSAAMWVINLNGEFPWKLDETRYEDVSPWAISAFRSYLGKSYGSIDQLNKEWKTHFASFGEIGAPFRKESPEWTHFCAFMIEGVIGFYEPIAANARKLLGNDAIVLLTGGYLTKEPFVSFAKRYSLWLSSHSQENPQFISWASLWRSHNVVLFGEPGLVNIDMIDVNRAFFINTICSGVLYTYRQYDWPNLNSWSAFVNQQTIGDKLVKAEPMRLPVALAGMFSNGVAMVKKSVSIGGVWYPVGCFNDAFLKAGVMADFYDGENPEMLQGKKAVLELGSSFFSKGAIGDLNSYVRSGGTLLLFPPLESDCGRRLYEQPQDKNGDVLLKALGNTADLTRIAPNDTNTAIATGTSGSSSWLDGFQAGSFSGYWTFQGALPPESRIDLTADDGTPAVVQWPCGKGSVIHFSGELPDRRIYGNGKSGVGGTGWNLTYKSPETQNLIARLTKHLGLSMPYEFRSDAPDTWACGFTEGTTRYILFYNNEAVRPTQVTVEKLSKQYFPANSYQLSVYSLRTELKTETRDSQLRDSFSANISMEPYGLCLLELKPTPTPEP